MQMYVSELRYAVPPQKERIDVRERFWIRDCLQQLLTRMVDIRLDPSVEVLRRAEQYRTIVESLAFVVINYVSVSRPGQIAGRHSAALINPSNFEIRPSAGGDQSDIREENYVFFPDGVSLPAGEEVAIKELWFNRWKAYHGRLASPMRFTLNQELLFSVTNPRPIFLSWFEGERPEEVHQLLTPVALNASRDTFSSWTLPAGEPARHRDLERFAAGFRGMYGGEEAKANATDEAIAACIGRVVDYFGDLGGDCFFSIPSSICVHAGGAAIDDYHERSAVVSVSLKHPWDAKLYEAAWEFFSGVANQILTDIMNSEYLAYQHDRWERSRANAVYLASHPLKHRLGPLQNTSAEVPRDLRALAREVQPDLSAKLLALADRADLVSKAASTASKFVNFMNVLADLLDQERAQDAIKRSKIAARLLPIGSDGWIETTEQLRAAARNAVDRTGFRTIALHGTLNPFYVARRLNSGRLKRHFDVEPQLIALLFGELFQNAANYGLIPAGGDVGAVPVQMTNRDSANLRYIVLENLIHPDFDEQSLDILGRVRVDEDRFRTASGLTVAAELAKQLQLGTVIYTILPAARASLWPDQADSNLNVWRSTILLEQ